MLTAAITAYMHQKYKHQYHYDQQQKQQQSIFNITERKTTRNQSR